MSGYSPSAVPGMWLHPLQLEETASPAPPFPAGLIRAVSCGEGPARPQQPPHVHDWYPSRRAVSVIRRHVGPPLVRHARHATPQQDLASMQSPVAAPFMVPVADDLPAGQPLRRSLAGLRAQKRRNRAARVVLAFTVVAMLVAGIAMWLYKPSRDVWVTNALDHAVQVQFGKEDKPFTVAPHAVVYHRLIAGDYEVVVNSPDGHEISRDLVQVPFDQEFSCYNVLGATSLTLVRYNFKNRLADSWEPLDGHWVTARRADWAFEPEPTEIATFSGDQLIRYAVQAYPEVPDWRVTHKLLTADSRENGADLLAAVCLATSIYDNDRDSGAVEEIARAHGSKRAQRFIDQLDARRPLPPGWRDAMHDLLDRLVRGGAANVDAGGDPDKSAWVEIGE